MPWSDKTSRVVELRAWFATALESPARARDDLDAMFAMAGDLFDEGNLDGCQYEAVAEVARALRETNDAQTQHCARACLLLIG